MNRAKISEGVCLLARVGLVSVVIIIAILSLLPGSDLPSPNMNDKLNHVIAYTVLAGLAVHARLPLSLPLVILFTIGYGILLELGQGLMPYGRSASWLDAVANLIGVLLGTFLGAVSLRWLNRL